MTCPINQCVTIGTGWPKWPQKDIRNEQQCKTARRHPLSFVDNTKNYFINSLVILALGLILLLKYIRSGTRAVLDAVIAILGS
jgi:hypothetical protein